MEMMDEEYDPQEFLSIDTSQSATTGTPGVENVAFGPENTVLQSTPWTDSFLLDLLYETNNSTIEQPLEPLATSEPLWQRRARVRLIATQDAPPKIDNPTEMPCDNSGSATTFSLDQDGEAATVLKSTPKHLNWTQPGTASMGPSTSNTFPSSKLMSSRKHECIDECIGEKESKCDASTSTQHSEINVYTPLSTKSRPAYSDNSVNEDSMPAIQESHLVKTNACKGNELSETAIPMVRHLCPHQGCGKHFSTSGHARRHSRLHTSHRPYSCPQQDCSATFARKDNCQQHQRRRHGQL